MCRAFSVDHGNYQVNEYEVSVTQAMRDQAMNFAQAIKLTDNQYSRLLPDELRAAGRDAAAAKLELEILRTYVGKLGELVFLTFLGYKNIPCDTTGMFDIYEGQENTDAFDFVTGSGKSVDIKTGFRSNHTRLLVTRDQFEHIPKDIYVAVRLIATDVPGNAKLIYPESVETAEIKGYADKEYMERLNYRDFGEAPAKCVPYDRLMGIDRLIRDWNR